MVSFKTTKGTVAFGFTIVLIVIFFVFLYAYFQTKRNDTINLIIFYLGIFTFFTGLGLAIANSIYKNNNELSDSDSMNKALMGIPISILLITAILAAIAAGSNGPAPSSGPPLRLGASGASRA